MKKVLITLALVVLGLTARTQRADVPQQQYIDSYSALAVAEMLRTGVPASITLAQGILESRSGLSALATEGNNHFGIKCHKDWTGRTMHLDDDRRNECFRVYDTPEESFRHHSDFLRYRVRYKFLFDLELTDYKGWAYGLKQAGYATDPSYAAKLIKCIEDYDLARFDILTPEEAAALPEPPHKIEEPKAVYTPGMAPAPEQYRFPTSRMLYSLNGVPFVYAMEGETYASLAKYYHLFIWEILGYNDLKASETLMPGTIVYLDRKKAKAPKGLEKYIVAEDGESFHAICQRFAVREKAVLRRNGLSRNPELHEGDEIKLR